MLLLEDTRWVKKVRETGTARLQAAEREAAGIEAVK